MIGEEPRQPVPVTVGDLHNQAEYRRWQRRMSRGEAQRWARRLRKLGFSPVEVRCDETGGIAGRSGAFVIRANWPYDYPDDVVEVLTCYGEPPRHLMWIASAPIAQAVVTAYEALRLGMGSRALPNPREGLP